MNKDGYTPLHMATHGIYYMATKLGRISVVKLLLDRGGNPNITDKEGWSPLHRAADKGYVDVINLLLHANTYTNRPNKDGNIFLHILTAKQNPRLILEVKQAIEHRQLFFLNNLQESMRVICPPLSNMDSKLILAEIVAYDYVQGISWHIKNKEGKAVADYM